MGLSPNAVFGIKFQISVNFVKNFFANITIFPQNFLKKFPKNLKFSTQKSIRRQTHYVFTLHLFLENFNEIRYYQFINII